MVTLNDPDDILTHCVSTALKMFILYSDWQTFNGKVKLPDWIWHWFEVIFPAVWFYLEKQSNTPVRVIKHLPGDSLKDNCNNLP